MKLVEALQKQSSNKRCEWLESHIGRSRRGFWGKDTENTYWILTTKSYNDSFKIIKNVKYAIYEFHVNDTEETVTIRMKCLKSCKNILMYCPSKQYVWQVRLYAVDFEHRNFKFQVIHEWNLNKFKSSKVSRKILQGQSLLCDFL